MSSHPGSPASRRFTPDELGFDPEALRRKYRAERDRRIRPDGAAQYRRAAGEFGYYAADPYTERAERPAVRDSVEALVVGGGFGGLLAGARLREAGVEDIRMVDEAGDFGGTWYWNRYPGIHCDIESYVYLPLLEEVGYVPKWRYAPGEEIRQHAVAIAQAVRPLPRRHVPHPGHRAALGRRRPPSGWCAPTAATTSAPAMSWSPRGTLTQPKLPGIPGIETFRGHTFHTSRWDYGYTGGDRGRRPERARGQEGRRRRHRRHRHPGHPAPRPRRRAAVRLPAHAVVGGRARQPPHRPGAGPPRSTGLAAGADGQLPVRRHRRRRRGGPRRRRLDQHARRCSARCSAAPSTAELSAEEREHIDELADFAKMNRDPRPGRRRRRRPGHGRAAQTLVPLHVQAADVQRPLPADVQPAQRHPGRHRGLRRHHADDRERRGRRRPRVRGRLRHLRHRLRGRRLRRPLRHACRCTAAAAMPLLQSLGAAARGRCTASTATGSRTCSTSARCRTPPSVNFVHILQEQADPHRRGRRRGPRARRPPHRAHRRGRGRLGRHDPRERPRQPRVPVRVHPRLLQQRGQAAGREQLVRPRPGRLPRPAARVARRRRAGRRPGRRVSRAGRPAGDSREIRRMMAPLWGSNGVAFGPDGRLYVAQFLAGRISAVDLASGDLEDGGPADGPVAGAGRSRVRRGRRDVHRRPGAGPGVAAHSRGRRTTWSSD